MNEIIGVVENALKALVPALIVLIGVWFKGRADQKKRDAINELDFSSEKVRFNVDSKPLSTLVSESNERHGADRMVKTPGSDTKD